MWRKVKMASGHGQGPRRGNLVLQAGQGPSDLGGDLPGDTGKGERSHSPAKAARDRVGGEEGAQDVRQACGETEGKSSSRTRRSIK